MRILIVTSLYPPIVGGAEKQAQLLARSLLKRHCQVEVLTQSLKGLSGTCWEEGILVHRTIRTLNIGKTFGLTYLLSSVWNLWRLRSHYDIIHSLNLSLHTCVAALMGKPTLGRPSGDMDLESLKQMTGARLWLRLIRATKLFVAISQPIAKRLEDIGIVKEKIVLLPNGVDTDYFQSVSPEEKRNWREKLQLSNDHQYVICCGRLAPEKNIGFLIELWTQVLRKFPRAHLLIIGDGTERKYLEDLIQRLDLTKSIHLHGAKEDVRPWLWVSDLLVLPSLREGCSNTILEAMAAGIPCVATRVGANNDMIVSGGNGILVDLHQRSDMVQAIVQLLKNPEMTRQMGLSAREAVVRHHSLSLIIDQYIQIYNTLLSAPEERLLRDTK